MSDFFRRGITKAWWVATVVDIYAPLATEVLAGTDLSPRLSEMENLTLTDAPAGPFTEWGSETGSYELGQADTQPVRLSFWEQRQADVLMALLARGVPGNLVVFPVGTFGSQPGPGDVCEVWPMTCSGPRREYTTAVKGAAWSCLLLPRTTPALVAVLS